MFIDLSRNIIRFLSHLGFMLVNSIFPSKCINCKQLIMDNLSLCGDCWQQLDFISDNCCYICANFMGDINSKIFDKQVSCLQCQNKPPFFDQTIAIFYFNEIIQQIIYEYKFNDQPQLSRFFIKFFTNRLKSFLPQIDLILPVPLSYPRLIKRKYNQSALIVKLLYNQFSLKKISHNILIRSKHTIPQSGLNFLQRKKNIENAFDLKNATLVKGKNILLIDDIITTGATINEIAKLLKQYGAKRVMVASIARTKLKHIDINNKL